MAKLAFCGTGRMGAPMAARLLAAGHRLNVWNRTPERADALVAKRAHRASTPADASRGVEAAITMVSTPEALEQVVFGPEGLAEGLPAGASLIDMSTVGPEVVRQLASRLSGRAEVIDAPVLGTVPQAQEGSLHIYFGGSPSSFERWKGVLSAMGAPRYVGGPGAGAALKLVVNSTLGALMVGLGEALSLADALGVEERVALDALADSPIAPTVKRKRANIEGGQYPANFSLALAAKDMGLVCRAAARVGRPLEMARAIQEHFAAARARGLGELDYSAVIAHIRGKPAS
ncbi:MAG: NAD(P)-dependent oxidoreductase [Myxococcales bacterium]|nr:NAD(P)-dependent oxidoreductase [Myxococcales bacterium]